MGPNDAELFRFSADASSAYTNTDMQTCQASLSVAARGLSTRSRSAAVAPGFSFSARVGGAAVQHKALVSRNNSRANVTATASGRTLPIDLRGALFGQPERLGTVPPVPQRG